MCLAEVVAAQISWVVLAVSLDIEMAYQKHGVDGSIFSDVFHILTMFLASKYLIGDE